MRLLLFTALLLTGTSFTPAGRNFSLKSVKASVQGTSTLHEWKSDITKIEFKGSLHEEGNALKTIEDVEVKIPVVSIKSTEGKKMDNKTYEAFKSEKNPFIIYTFNSAQVKEDANHIVTIETSGNLTMAGVTQTVSLNATGTVLENGDLHLSVSKKLKMTDFKMVPPTMFMGTIKVGDKITVNFDLILTH